MDTLQERIRALRQSWRKPMTHAEMRALMESAACLEGLEPDEWKILGDYLHARIPEGTPKYQPNSRIKFIEAAPDVWAYAFNWAQKQGKGGSQGKLDY